MVNHIQFLEKVINHAKASGVSVRLVDEMPKSIRPTPIRGAFRMGEVLLPKNSPEEALFVLLHGLGHMAQWSLFPEEHKNSYRYNSIKSWDDISLKKLWDHEWRALPYVLGFLKQHRLNILRDWYIRYFIADQQYIAEIFRENNYDLQKFYATLGKIQNADLEEVYRSVPFPTLNLRARKSEFICVV